ncbi:MAG TPA: hypothetical protein VK761_10385 [Solirubrobacteraceae bacterium]|nr:hypothetical protein [Solirubrobacteraceae bacterium]
MRSAATGGGLSPADEVALVACARRELLLRAHSYRLRREDLEDCFSQATLELIAHAHAGGTFASRRHIAHTLELKLLSRIHDRRRALGGRSPMQAALEDAAALDANDGQAGAEIVDLAADVETRVLVREQLRAIERCARELTSDQRLALAAQLAGDERRICAQRGWSHERFRKLAQRARARLRDLVQHDLAYVSGLAAPVGLEAGTEL